MSDGAKAPMRRVARAPHVSPEVLDRREDGNSLEENWRVPMELDCWPGHFPEQSILPGVLQIDWLMRTIESWAGCSPRLVRIEALKFKQLVLPGERLTLRLDRDTGSEVFRFRLGTGDAIVSSGRVVLDATPEGEA